MTVYHEPAMATMTLPARLPSVALGITFVANHASAAGLLAQRVAEIELVVDEALVNICHYAYRNKVGSVEVRCNRDGTRQFYIKIIDAGEPFNILTLPPPNPMATLDQRPVGGLGVLLIRSLVDNGGIRRVAGRAVLESGSVSYFRRLLACLPAPAPTATSGGCGDQWPALRNWGSGPGHAPVWRD
jgi:anti-sigma regulatory factor (Ser/Thr protein kinase)